MEKTLSKKSGAREFVKALIVSIIFTLLSVLVFAVIIRFCSIDAKYIPIVNQIIKCVAILLSMLLCFTKRPNGWLRGFIFGILYIAAAFFIFSAFSGKFEFGLKLLNDCVLGGISGLIGGIITVNVKKRSVEITLNAIKILAKRAKF